MMKMTTMKKLVDTLNEKYESPIATEIAGYWGCDKGSVIEQRISANAVFRFKKSGKDHFLRFNPPSERSFDYIKAEIDFLQFLAAKNIHIARPVRSLANNLIEKIDLSLDTYYGVVFEALTGKQYEIGDLDASQFHAWGKALGTLHHVSTGYKTRYRLSWKEYLEQAAQFIPQDDKYGQQELAFILGWAARLPVNEQNFGLIHYDFELDNIFWNNNEISILDFDDCQFHWYIADIANALEDLFKDKVDFNNENFLAFMSGYDSKMPVDNELLKELPLFRRMDDLVTYAKLLRSFEGSKPDGDDEWQRLWHKIRSCIATYEKRFEQYHK